MTITLPDPQKISPALLQPENTIFVMLNIHALNCYVLAALSIYLDLY